MHKFYTSYLVESIREKIFYDDRYVMGCLFMESEFDKIDRWYYVVYRVCWKHFESKHLNEYILVQS